MGNGRKYMIIISLNILNLWIISSLYHEKRRKFAMPVSETKGKIVLNLDASEASSDRLKYGRLKKLAEKGDENARKEI